MFFRYERNEVKKTVTRIINARIYRTDDACFVPGTLAFAEGRIVDSARAADVTIDAHGAYLAPGLVDVHTHGRAGTDFINADDAALRRMALSYLESGVTTLMPTLASAPYVRMQEATGRIAAAIGHTDGARFAGIHFEGRYLNPQKRGAHAPDLLASLCADELNGLADRMTGKGQMHITAAFELDADGSFAERARALGMTLGIGHTMATYDQARLAEQRGVTAYTHLFNAMPPLHHREGGAVCAALTGDAFCEMICDGFHIAPEVVRLTYACKGEKLVLITDSMEATGCADGEYAIAGMPVTVTNGRAYTSDGAIAGSTLNLLDGVRNLAAFAGIPFEKALYCATASPAKEIGIYDMAGSLHVGKRADFLLLDRDYGLREVWLAGEKKSGK